LCPLCCRAADPKAENGITAYHFPAFLCIAEELSLMC
jgi:hypothetical protein